ncbi:MAG: toxin-antitoxin system TumE family protein [Burkholderiales bacterium]
MPAQLITRFKNITPDGGVIELVVWRLPTPVPPTQHGYKYRAVYALGGVRVVGFDNERGKGDHCHLDGVEVPYTFVSVEQLVEDFIAAVAARRQA